MLLKVRGVPFLHPQYGFSINVQFMQPTGEGSLKRAAQLLEAKLTAEGLFDDSRKRPILYPPTSVGLITSVNSAAYHDFIKIMGERWGGVEIQVADVQVQGDIAPSQIVSAFDSFNTHKEPVDVIVLIRGGGSADDLAAFNSEIVTRAVATSRIPTLVAIGHEVDVSLAEKAADKRGSTPTHAAEFLTPDRNTVLKGLDSLRIQLAQHLDNQLNNALDSVDRSKVDLDMAWETYIEDLSAALRQHKQLIELLSPLSALKRGYAVIRKANTIITSGKSIASGDTLSVELADSNISTVVKDVRLK